MALITTLMIDKKGGASNHGNIAYKNYSLVPSKTERYR